MRKRKTSAVHRERVETFYMARFNGLIAALCSPSSASHMLINSTPNRIWKGIIVSPIRRLKCRRDSPVQCSWRGESSRSSGRSAIGLPSAQRSARHFWFAAALKANTSHSIVHVQQRKGSVNDLSFGLERALRRQSSNARVESPTTERLRAPHLQFSELYSTHSCSVSNL